MDEIKKRQIVKNEGGEQRKIQKVVKNPVKIKKKSKLAKFAESFIVEDIKSVLSWGANEVVIPALKKLFVEFIDSTANSMVYGHSVDPRRRGSSTSNISYRDYYSSPTVRRTSVDPYDVKHEEVYSLGTVEVKTKEEAEDVIRDMYSYIERNGYIEVGVFMEMLGVNPRQTDFNWGWTSIAGARAIHRYGGGWEISLPRVMEIAHR